MFSINISKFAIMKKLANYHSMSNNVGSNPFNVMKVAFSPKAIDQIKKTIGSRHAENGGALFGKPEDLKSPIPYIREFVFDDNATTSHVTYTINTKYLNPVIHTMWDKHELELHGLIHSHPIGYRYPSGPDMTYFHDMHTYMKRPFLITPIVYTQPDGGFKMFCYLVGPETPAIEVEYCIMDEKEYEKAIAELGVVKQEEPVVLQQEEAIECKAYSKGADEDNSIDYSREADAMDIEKLKKSRIVIVSNEGQVCPIGSMLVRHGVSDIVAFDPSFTQGGKLALGTSTILALGEHIKEINPNVKYTPYGEIRYITKAEEKDIFSSASLAIFLTDSIYIAAYGTKISKQFHIPTIWAYSNQSQTNLELLFRIPDDEKVICCWYQNALKPESAKSTKLSFDSLTAELAVAIVQKEISGSNYQNWLDGKFDKKFLRTQVIEQSLDTPSIHAEKNDEDGLVTRESTGYQIRMGLNAIDTKKIGR